MQVVAGIHPLRLRAAHSLLGRGDIRPGLLHCRRPAAHIGFRAVDVGLRYRDGAYQSRDLSALVGDLSFEGRLIGDRLLQGIPVRPVVDFEQEIALLHELVVMDIQTD